MADVVQITLPDGNTYDIKDSVARGMVVSPATETPLMDSGNGSVGTSAKYAREDHVHPTDTSRQEALVSGTNIKTINGTSILGSGNITTPNTTYTLSGAVSSHKFTTTLTPSSGTATTSNLTLAGGTGISLTDGTNKITINHSNSITAGTAGTSSATSGSSLAVPYVTYDAQGHITAKGTHTHTVTGFLPIYNGTGRNETFKWGWRTNSDPDEYPYLRLHSYSTTVSDQTMYGVSFGPVDSSSSAGYSWRVDPEYGKLNFPNSGFRIGADQGSDVSTQFGGINGTWFVGNQSAQYNGSYGFLGRGSESTTDYIGFIFNPYEGEISFRSNANRTGDDTIINEAKVAKWDTIAAGSVGVLQATYIASTNSTYVSSIDDFDCNRWGDVLTVYIRFTIGTAVPSSGSTIAIFTIANDFKLTNKYAWFTLNNNASPYSVTSTGSVFLNGTNINGRGLAAGTYRATLTYVRS